MKQYQKLPVYASMLTTLITGFVPSTVNSESLEGVVVKSPQDGLYMNELYLPVNTNQGRKVIHCNDENTLDVGLTELAHYIVKGDNVRINSSGNTNSKIIDTCDITVLLDKN